MLNFNGLRQWCRYMCLRTRKNHSLRVCLPQRRRTPRQMLRTFSQESVPVPGEEALLFRAMIRESRPQPEADHLPPRWVSLRALREPSVQHPARIRPLRCLGNTRPHRGPRPEATKNPQIKTTITSEDLGVSQQNGNPETSSLRAATWSRDHGTLRTLMSQGRPQIGRLDLGKYWESARGPNLDQQAHRTNQTPRQNVHDVGQPVSFQQVVLPKLKLRLPIPNRDHQSRPPSPDLRTLLLLKTMELKGLP